jgi:hypothetical protein
MPAQNNTGAALLARFTPDLLKVLTNAPAHGSVHFEITFHDGDPVRFNYGVDISKLARPDRGRV